MGKLPQDKAIVFFDGVCNLCNRFIQFVIKKEKKDYFRFSALSTELGQSIINQNRIKDDSIILFENGKIYTQSDAVLRIYRHLLGFYPILYYSIYFPKFIRNAFYKIIAKNRYHLLGRRNECWLPTSELIQKFLK